VEHKAPADSSPGTGTGTCCTAAARTVTGAVART
jgi:hypothetical protein